MTSTPRLAKLPVFFYLKLVGKISAVLALTAAAGLALVIALLVNDKGASYREIISVYGVAHENLQLALLVFGLVMVVVAAMATRLVTLYASFGFAGPLCRFSRNLELVTEQGPVAPVPLRATDQLQRECAAFRNSVSELRRHYSDLTGLVQQIENALTRSDAGELELLLARLQEAERRARL
jgi:hypothetical protein